MKHPFLLPEHLIWFDFTYKANAGYNNVFRQVWRMKHPFLLPEHLIWFDVTYEANAGYNNVHP
jgi:hypothetical protein